MSKRVTDEMIMALADGELQGPEADAVREAIAADSKLQDQFDAYQASRRMLAEGFEGLLERPVPDAMTRLMLEEKADGDTVVRLDSARARRRQPFGLDIWSMAAAAGVALSAAAFSGYQFGQDQPAAERLVLAGLVPEDSSFHAALSASPAGTVVDVGQTDFTAVATYQTANGQVCREFELMGDGSRTVGLACRVDAGWQVEIAAINVTGGQPGAFLPASADAFEIIGTVLDAKGTYEPVDPADEGCVLNKDACTEGR